MIEGAVIIFDLDGTLVDSAPGIISAINATFASFGMKSKRHVDESLIGPPLGELFRNLVEDDDSVDIRALSEEFSSNYDFRNYKETYPFDGIEKMLHDLVSLGAVLFIATNKREVPALRIIDHLGWGMLFKKVYTIDGLGGPFRNKADMLRYILRVHGLNSARTLYVGDRNEDGQASVVKNGMQFIFAGWGYRDVLLPEGAESWKILDYPDAVEILELCY